MGASDVGASSKAIFSNLLRAMLGTGLLTLPAYINCMGASAALALLVVLTVLAVQTMKQIANLGAAVDAERGRNSERGLACIAQRAGGFWARAATTFSLQFTNCGITVVYLVFVGDTLRVACRASWCTALDVQMTQNSSLYFANLAALPIVLGLVHCSTRQLALLAGLGTLSLIVAVAYILSDAVPKLNTTKIAAALDDAPNWAFLGTYISCVAFGYVMHGVVLAQFGAASGAARRKFGSLLAWTGTLACIVYAAVGFVAAVAYRDEGVRANILDNLPNSPLALSVRALVIVPVLTSIPIFLDPVFAALGCAVAPAEAAGSGPRGGLLTDDDPVHASPRTNSPMGRRTAGLRRMLLALFLGCVAYFAGDLVGQLVVLVGSVAMSLLGFILPPVLTWLARKRTLEVQRTTAETLLTVLAIVTGVLSMAFGSVYAVKGLLAYLTGRTADVCG